MPENCHDSLQLICQIPTPFITAIVSLGQFHTSGVSPVGHVQIFRYPKHKKAGQIILATAKFAVEAT
jgi:hypothetical protein